MTRLLVPHCFDARWDAATSDRDLSLEDLTESHSLPTKWPLPPTLEQCERIVVARAGFHAAWWDDVRLGCSVGVKPDLTKCFDFVVGSLPRERRLVYEHLFARGPELLTRSYAGRNLTIVHGARMSGTASCRATRCWRLKSSDAAT